MTLQDHTFTHGDVTITMQFPLMHRAKARVLEASLGSLIDAEGTEYPELQDLDAVGEFIALASVTTAVDGLDWEPIDFAQAKAPRTAMKSLLQFLEVVDRTLWEAWARAYVRAIAPVDDATGPTPLPEGTDPKASSDA